MIKPGTSNRAINAQTKGMEKYAPSGTVEPCGRDWSSNSIVPVSLWFVDWIYQALPMPRDSGRGVAGPSDEW